jgi:hypothetical protein
MKSDLKIIGLKKYAHGFTGCIETPDRYEFFHFARGKYKMLQQYLKADFEDRDHFIDVLRKFVHAGFFKQLPVAVSRISSEELEKVPPD